MRVFFCSSNLKRNIYSVDNKGCILKRGDGSSASDKDKRTIPGYDYLEIESYKNGGVPRTMISFFSLSLQSTIKLS